MGRGWIKPCLKPLGVLCESRKGVSQQFSSEEAERSSPQSWCVYATPSPPQRSHCLTFLHITHDSARPPLPTTGHFQLAHGAVYPEQTEHFTWMGGAVPATLFWSGGREGLNNLLVAT